MRQSRDGLQFPGNPVEEEGKHRAQEGQEENHEDRETEQAVKDFLPDLLVRGDGISQPRDERGDEKERQPEESSVPRNKC